jgi:hypothetical protein
VTSGPMSQRFDRLLERPVVGDRDSTVGTLEDGAVGPMPST